MRSCLSAIIPSLAAGEKVNLPKNCFSGNAKTRIFHVSGCRYFNCKACTVRFKSAEEARSNGYKPCKRCLAREGR